MSKGLNELTALIKRAEQDPKNKELFAEALRRAIALEVVTPLEIARGAKISMLTVKHWCDSEQPGPHYLGRPPAMRWLAAEVLKKTGKESKHAAFTMALEAIEKGQEAAREEAYLRSKGLRLDQKSDELFGLAIDLAMRSEAISVEEMREELSAAPSTFDRWRRVQTKPGPYTQVNILEWLKGKIEEKMKE